MHELLQWEKGRKGFVKHGGERVNDCTSRLFCSTACETLRADNCLCVGQGARKWGRQCPPARPGLSPKNLLLPFEGDFGEAVAISALPGTGAAVCLQNKALLFGGEPSSKSYCPQIKTGMEDYMLARSPAIPPSRCNCKDLCPLPNIAQCSCMSFMLPRWRP